MQPPYWKSLHAEDFCLEMVEFVVAEKPSPESSTDVAWLQLRGRLMPPDSEYQVVFEGRNGPIIDAQPRTSDLRIIAQ